MGYRDDFYIAENIIGYTGKIGKSPTVYFKCGQESGHITQYHENDANLGREQVLSDPQYKYGNKFFSDFNETVLFEEWPKHGIIHRSRNLLTFRDKISKSDFAVLCQVIWLYTKEKKYSVAHPTRINNPNYKEGESRVESLIKKFSK
jgi:hypothetical protein